MTFLYVNANEKFEKFVSPLFRPTKIPMYITVSLYGQLGYTQGRGLDKKLFQHSPESGNDAIRNEIILYIFTPCPEKSATIFYP